MSGNSAMKRSVFVLTLPLLAFLVAGCGSGAEGDAGRVDTFETTGKITYNGKPVEDAIVSFSPKGSHPAALGRTDANGTYSLRTYDEGDGAAAGDYIVLVTKETITKTPSAAHDPTLRGSATPSAGHGGGRGTPTTSTHETPVKYNSSATSNLEATVKSGKNTFDFDLKD